jgi:hypothetical protein
MMTPALGIDVSKDRLDVETTACGKPRSKYFANSPDGWRQLLAWLKELKIKRVHACLEATGRYSLGIALAFVGGWPYRQHRESGPDPRFCAHQAWPKQN